MKIEMRKFRIGALAERLNVERFVIRFWEKEFNIKPVRSSGKQRFYTERDFEKFATIKELLYDKGFTIAGAKKHLKKKRPTTNKDEMVASQVTTMEPEVSSAGARRVPTQQQLAADLTLQILELQKKLIRLRELL